MEKKKQLASSEQLLVRFDNELRSAVSYEERMQQLDALQRLEGVSAGNAARLIQGAHNRAMLVRRDFEAGAPDVTPQDVERVTAIASYTGLSVERVRNAYRHNKITSAQTLIADMAQAMYSTDDVTYRELIDAHFQAAYNEPVGTLIELAGGASADEKRLVPTKQATLTALGAVATTAAVLSMTPSASAYAAPVSNEVSYVSPQMFQEFAVPIAAAEVTPIDEITENGAAPKVAPIDVPPLTFSADDKEGEVIAIKKPVKAPEVIFIEPDLGNGNTVRDLNANTNQENDEERVQGPNSGSSAGKKAETKDSSPSSEKKKEKKKSSKAEKKISTSTEEVDVSRASETLWSKKSLEKINKNIEIYKAVGERTNTPWQLGAALHMRESSLGMKNPSNGQGVFQLYTLNKSHGYSFPAGKVSKAEFERQLELAITFLKDAEVARGASPDDFDFEHPDVLKSSLFTYNGRAGAYERQAQALGFSHGFEGSPYVMNLADDKRNSEKNPEWKQILTDGGTMSKANMQPGAWPLIEGLVKISTASSETETPAAPAEKPIEKPEIVGWGEGIGGAQELTYFNQHSAEWASKPYRLNNSPEASGTIDVCGCGPTSIASAVATMTGTDMNPEKMAAFFMENGGPVSRSNCASNWIWETKSAAFEREFGVRIERISGTDAAMKAAIDNGGMVIMSQGPGMFTSGGHIMVVSGYAKLPNKDGGDHKYIVSDSNSTRKTVDLEGYSPSVMIGNGKPVSGVKPGGVGANRGYLKAAWSITPVDRIAPAGSDVVAELGDDLSAQTITAYEKNVQSAVENDKRSQQTQLLYEDVVVSLHTDEEAPLVSVPKVTKEQRRAVKLYAKLG